MPRLWGICRASAAAHVISMLYLLCNVGFLLILSVGFLQGRDAMSRRKTLRDEIEERMARKKGDALFLPREFADLGGEDQVLRALAV